MTSKRALRIGTRGSKLALAQTQWVMDALRQRFPDLSIETVIVKTKGDQIIDKPLYKSPGKGFFVKEIEDRLLSGEIDLAVHSLKDMPTELPPGLTIAAICNRIEPRDALVAGNWETVKLRNLTGGEFPNFPISQFPTEWQVGTSSLRRQAQLRHTFPGWQLLDLRGNVDTRLRKLDEGQYDAIVVAAAGLIRLGLQERITCLLPIEVCVPCAGQGALAVEARADDVETVELLKYLDEPTVRAEISAERGVVSTLHAGCHAAIGVYAKADGSKLTVHAAVAALDGTHVLRDSVSGLMDDPEALGKELGEKLLARGAAKLLMR